MRPSQGVLLVSLQAVHVLGRGRCLLVIVPGTVQAAFLPAPCVELPIHPSKLPLAWLPWRVPDQELQGAYTSMLGYHRTLQAATAGC